MNQVGIALIGAGNIAQNVHLPILSTLPNARVVAIYDKNKTTARAIAERYNIPYICKDLKEVLELESVQAVDICASTDAHCDLTIACLEGGKDVLIEKPMAPTMQQTIAMADAAERTGQKLMVAMNHRFRPDTAMLKQYIDQGNLGSVYYIKSGWLQQRSSEKRWLNRVDKSGHGVMLDLGIVLLDVILWLYGFKKVQSVHAIMQKHATKNVEDFVVGLLNFADGMVVNMEASWSLMRPEEFYYCNIFGEEGSAFINPLKIMKRKDGEFTEVPGVKIRSTEQLYKKSYHAELQHFVNAVQDLVPVISTGREAVERMRIVDALYLSAKERQEITL